MHILTTVKEKIQFIQIVCSVTSVFNFKRKYLYGLSKIFTFSTLRLSQFPCMLLEITTPHFAG